MAEPVEALLFDLGGVIIDVDFARVVRRWAELAGCNPTLVQKRFGPDEAFRKHERGTISDTEYFATLRGSLGLDLTDGQFLDGWNAIYGGVIAGVAEQLEAAAAHLPVYAFTNTNPAHERYWSVRFASTIKHFRQVFVSSSIGLRKPDADAFAYVASEIDVPAERILFFDDSLANVDGARACGLQAVHVRSNADVAAALATLLPDDLRSRGKPCAARPYRSKLRPIIRRGSVG